MIAPSDAWVFWPQYSTTGRVLHTRQACLERIERYQLAAQEARRQIESDKAAGRSEEAIWLSMATADSFERLENEWRKAHEEAKK